MNYVEAVKQTWRHTEGALPDDAAKITEIVRYATLAPSGHNTQCWKFRAEPDSISILPDLSRRTPVVDPDDHHLYVSLGCAAENLIQAAAAFGFEAQADVNPGSGVVKMSLAQMMAEETAMFRAIPHRQCTRCDYDGKALTNDELRQLEAAGAGNGVRLLLLTERTAMEHVLEYVVAGNTRQVGNPAFVQELEGWIRFGDAEAVRTGDGLNARSTGNPPSPRWLGRILFRMFFQAKAENDKCARHLRSSAGVGVFVSDANDKAHWIEAGRCYERFALQATALGIRNAFLNQPVEEAELRPAFAQSLGLGQGRPDLIVRFGRGKEMPRSLRRPVEDVWAG